MVLRSLVVAGLLCCGTANAGDAGRALAQRSVCLACHQVDVKRVGPSFRDIAIRYAGVEGAADYLARAIREGSRGLWGAIPMPAQRNLDPVTTMQLAEWILTLAPAAAQNAQRAKSEAAGDVIDRDLPEANNQETGESQVDEATREVDEATHETSAQKGGTEGG